MSSLSPSSTHSASMLSYRRHRLLVVLVAAAAAVGTGVLSALVIRRRKESGGAGLLAYRSEGAVEEPRLAVAEALAAIRAGRCSTCGELVAFLRGSPKSAVSVAARYGVLAASAAVGPGSPRLRQLPPSNAHCLRIPAPILHYVQEAYIPAVRQSGVETASQQVEYQLFTQMVASDVVLQALNVERATPFDKDNLSHVNLLQQLWMTTGQATTPYSRTGPQWGTIGFQGEDPVTDLRGGGVLALRQLVHFAQTHNGAFREMLAYNERVQRAGKHSWYLLAVVSIQLSTQLMLEQDHLLFLPHLEMVYDTLRQNAVGDTVARPISRRALAVQKNVSLASRKSADTAAFWDSCKDLCSADAGMFALHHALLLHFKECWERDEPHVMEYSTYMPSKVFSTFFTPTWSGSALKV